MSVVFFLFFNALCTIGQTLHINMVGVRSASGNIRLAFYNTSQGFDDEKPLFIKTVSKTSLVKNGMKITYTDLKPGIYGIAVLDDENKNEKMDYGLLLPEEGFGFSDYFHTGMRRPKFDQFDFVLMPEGKTVEIKLRYL
ncbi:MAG TPA: DUF2141 domain-containing protein [Bacteroidia bacterium]|nr:DUF2141 domain-containing protein [Bacteroidia bacterium]